MSSEVFNWHFRILWCLEYYVMVVIALWRHNSGAWYNALFRTTARRIISWAKFANTFHSINEMSLMEACDTEYFERQTSTYLCEKFRSKTNKWRDKHICSAPKPLSEPMLPYFQFINSRAKNNMFSFCLIPSVNPVSPSTTIWRHYSQ